MLVRLWAGPSRVAASQVEWANFGGAIATRPKVIPMEVSAEFAQSYRQHQRKMKLTKLWFAGVKFVS